MSKNRLPCVALLFLMMLFTGYTIAARPRTDADHKNAEFETAGIPSMALAAAQDSRPDSRNPVTVPTGDGTPVITDGVFSPGEWDDALSLPIQDSVTLYLKEYRGVVFIGIRGRGNASIGPSELYLSLPGGTIHKLHVSFQLFENKVEPGSAEPPIRFGLTPDWYASEFRRDTELAERMQKEGKDMREIMRATSYPSDGIEFAIRRAKFPGGAWLLRLWISAMVENRPSAIAFPAAAAEKTTEGWLELRFK
jgi:hypothetical protein